MPKGWIGVDADKTLFAYANWEGVDQFGTPIPKMVERIRFHLEQGHEVRLFTARVSDPEWESLGQSAWEAISQKLFGTVLEATNQKDYQMIFVYDDKAVQVEENTGELTVEVAVRKALARRKYEQA